MATSIEVENLTKVFGDLMAVDHVSFNVDKGTIFGYLGPNGAGKTTTLRILSTVLKPSDGTARVLGHDILKEAEQVRSVIGVLPEDTGIYERLTPVETLCFYGRVHGMESDLLKRKIDELLEMLALSDKRDTVGAKLSKGMKRKLAVLRAIIHDPEVLILDEPTLGLDVMSAREIREFIRETAARGKTVILSTHNMWEAQLLCDRVAIIDKAKIVSIGTVEELEELTKEKSLEEIFLHLIRSEAGA